MDGISTGIDLLLDSIELARRMSAAVYNMCYNDWVEVCDLTAAESSDGSV